jgi:hypothetical protein
MRSRHQIAAQKPAQSMRIEPIALDLRVRYQSRFVRMSQYHLFHLLDLF